MIEKVQERIEQKLDQITKSAGGFCHSFAEPQKRRIYIEIETPQSISILLYQELCDAVAEVLSFYDSQITATLVAKLESGYIGGETITGAKK